METQKRNNHNLQSKYINSLFAKREKVSNLKQMNGDHYVPNQNDFLIPARRFALTQEEIDQENMMSKQANMERFQKKKEEMEDIVDQEKD